MVVLASMNNDINIVNDYNQFLEMIQRDYQMDAQDLAQIFMDAVLHYSRHPELEDAITEAVNQLDSDRKSNEDGIWGDDYYRAEEELRKTQDELRDEIVASLRSKSRKGNTKEDIARRLEAIISNMNYIL